MLQTTTKEKEEKLKTNKDIWKTQKHKNTKIQLDKMLHSFGPGGPAKYKRKGGNTKKNINI